MPFKDPSKGGYPFPSRPSPGARQVIDRQVAQAVERVRKANEPPAKVRAVNREAVIKEKDSGDLKQIDVTPKPKTPTGGNNSSF